jgi:hypothetical protein
VNPLWMWQDVTSLRINLHFVYHFLWFIYSHHFLSYREWFAFGFTTLHWGCFWILEVGMKRGKKPLKTCFQGLELAIQVAIWCHMILRSPSIGPKNAWVPLAQPQVFFSFSRDLLSFWWRFFLA